MEERLFQRIKTLTELQAPSGCEDEVREYLRKELTPLVDRVELDGLGGIFGIREHKESDAPRVMVAAHMDEVGFMVSRIEENGMFHVVALGGWNPYVVSAQRFTLITRTGEKIPVVSGSVPPHLLRGTNGQQALKIEDVLFDAGFYSKEEAESFGVRMGDYIVPQTETIYTANKKNIISKAWDNRYGVTMVLEALETLKNEQLNHTLIAGANVQEEVGLRGAQVSTTKFAPDLFFAVDASPANDTDKDPLAQGRLGQGTLMRIFDPGHIMLKRMREFLLDTAQTHNIPVQYYVSKGGTDAGAAHLKGNGIPSAVIGVPARYIHSHETMFAIADFEAAQELLLQVLRSLDKSTVQTLIYG
ncbi:glutamyl aminopeptidase [Pilibacter termitis]|uniref:Glutamyl aminopeptidase n=1 Tax=Pilibacter termitis TaxID=263852 RepID=A0A1T4MYU8_9ENTE|nr:glutamyl aminopeptidase [Pilibacter termitis]SJZ71925.1 glutamyl aminopeptidase [Pilibacter termitis]